MSDPLISALVLTNGTSVRVGFGIPNGSPGRAGTGLLNCPHIISITALRDPDGPSWSCPETFLVEDDEGTKAVIPYAHVVLIELQKEEKSE